MSPRGLPDTVALCPSGTVPDGNSFGNGEGNIGLVELLSRTLPALLHIVHLFNTVVVRREARPGSCCTPAVNTDESNGSKTG